MKINYIKFTFTQLYLQVFFMLLLSYLAAMSFYMHVLPHSMLPIEHEENANVSLRAVV